MVNRYLSVIRHFSLIFTLCVLPAITFADLDISVTKATVELGKPIELILRSFQTKVPLDNIDLEAVKDSFHIKNIGDVEYENNQQSQKIVIYPRTLGQLVIPQLYFINTKTQPIKINVTQAKDPKDESLLDVNFSVSTFNPWEKQQVLVKLELISHSPILVLNAPEAYSDYSDIITLNKYDELLSNNHKAATRHLAGWSVFPIRTGQHTIELPAVQLIRDGITTHRFYPPLLKLDIKPLPVYIPSTMPVGKLELSTTHAAKNIIFTNSISNTGFVLKGFGIRTADLPSLVYQLKSNEARSFYPAAIKPTIHKSKTGVISENSYAINFKASQQGFTDLGKINLNYFDPDSGKIHSLEYSVGNTYSSNIVVAIITVVIVMLFSYILLAKFYTWILRQWRCLSGYKRILGEISHSTTALEIKDKLIDVANTENWHSNLTLRQWRNQWRENTGTTCPFDIDALEKMLYGDKHNDIELFKREIKLMCFIRWPILKLITSNK